MPLVVPVLRLLMLFFNVFETFKTLKPARSTRRAGRPSARALTQRKRDMKGCLAVWIVWCCITVYERMFENFFSLVVPFYSEIKSIVLLFFIVTRARGAEPIYLHLIRPMIKPYAMTVDSLLDLARMFGDIFFIVVTVPLQHGLAWWNGSLWETEDVQEDVHEIQASRPASPVNAQSLEPESPVEPEPPTIVPVISEPSPISPAEEPQPITRTTSASGAAEEQDPPSTSDDKGNSQVDLVEPEVLVRTQSSSLRAGNGHVPSSATTAPVGAPLLSTARRSDGNKRKDRRNGQSRSPTNPPKPHEPQVYRYQLSESSPKAVPAQPNHEVWHPPTSAYEGSDRDAPPGRSEPQSSTSGANATPPCVEPESAVLLEVDEWRLYPPFPSAYPPTPLPVAPAKLVPTSSNIRSSAPRRPSVRIQPISEERQPSRSRTHLPHRELSNSDGTLSDGKLSTTGTTGAGDDDSSSDGEGMNVDSEDATSEDDFDATLQTPRRQRNGTFPIRRMPLSSMPSDSSISSSAKLSTADRGSTLRSRSSSESSSPSLSDDSSSVVGQKRSFPGVDGPNTQDTVKLGTRYTAQTIQLPARQASTSASESLDDKAEFDIGFKKRRVATVPASKVGPTPARAPGSDATLRGRGRGRGQAPTRASSRIANVQAPALASASSNSSQSTLAGAKPGKATPALRERNTRNRT